MLSSFDYVTAISKKYNLTLKFKNGYDNETPVKNLYYEIRAGNKDNPNKLFDIAGINQLTKIFPQLIIGLPLLM